MHRIYKNIKVFNDQPNFTNLKEGTTLQVGLKVPACEEQEQKPGVRSAWHRYQFWTWRISI